MPIEARGLQVVGLDAYGRRCLHDPLPIRQATLDEEKIAARIRKSLLAMREAAFWKLAND